MDTKHSGSAADLSRVAALYDIHGNLTALEAVLTEVDDLGVDRIVVGGDIAWGPQPLEVVETLRARTDVVAIRGNADRELAARLGVADGFPEEIAAINAWCADRLGEAHLAWLGNLPFTQSLEIGGEQVLFCHATPRSDEEIVTPETSEDRLRAAIAAASESTLVCGHIHIRYERTCAGKRVLNAGSVGLPYEDAVGAYWALLGPGIELRCTPYDVGAAVERFRASGCPHVDEVFVGNLVSPEGRDKTIAHFDSLAAARGA